MAPESHPDSVPDSHLQSSGSAGSQPIPVLLLKTKSSPTDPYDTLFSSTGEYTPIFVPVLQHHNVNDDVVKGYILDGSISFGKGRFGGLIITSQRAVEALGGLLDELKESNKDLIDAFFSQTRIYVVGPATKKALVNLGFSPENVLGGESGNGLALSDYIIETYSPGEGDLLFLTGETHSTTIPTRVPEKLKSEKELDMKIEEVVVYKTGVMEGFEDEFRGWLEKLDKNSTGDEAETRWIVVFSPTGTDAALKVANEKGENEKVKYKVCTIGPTTSDFLWQAFKRKPDAMAKIPSPQGLMDAVKNGSRMALEVVL
ncbi:hypothetical protein H072_113 [Dactylellina haptotyla CBS 200.50]|uniref:Tetrapyrrole biosynthesis uroporphyrinogen III synthase domain-containing protein n=1 Tax=Dactylellina haptotyla (strain CBS 200.50) TaxID=1284197 RepID=S8CDG2_DACHA|nr:hypothetical protein H072_113 [Dactylellina haptotyla CBS 200.50]